MLDLTIIIPGIRTERWEKLYNESKIACKKFSHEIFYVGPKYIPASLENKDDVRYLRCLSTPSVGVQQAVSICRGKYFLWLVDDSDLRENSIDMALQAILDSDEPQKNIVYCRYTEREHGKENELPRFWEAYFHNDLKQPLVKPDWKIAPIFLAYTKWFKELGGLDCTNYEHINMNAIGFSFRVQELGFKVLYPPSLIMSCELQRNRNTSNNAVISAFFDNDLPNFKKEYASGGELETHIEYDNWLNQPIVWERKRKIEQEGKYLIGDNEGTV